MSNLTKIAIVGGHGNVSMRLARILSARPNTQVLSIFRNPQQTEDVSGTGASPLVLSLEDDPKEKFAEAFENKDIIYFSAGAGGGASPERTRKVDYEGALKVFDAIELVNGEKPRLIIVSAIDIRDPNVIPAHYNDEDKAVSEMIRNVMPVYMQAKYDADKNLVKRTAFKWTIIRPGGLSNEPGTGKASIGRAHFKKTISKDDIAYTLALLADRPDAAGLAIDVAAGDDKIEDALDAFIKKGETDFLG
ncbi:hypothetical protein ACEPAG_9399 [Sanghuangporus baumii]